MPRVSQPSCEHPAIVREIDTPHGPARAHLHAAKEPRGALMLGHGAGGGVGARDLVAVTGAANESGFTVALIEQPYRVAGRKAPAPATQLDAAWIAVAAALRKRELQDLPLIVGGRSAGARVACRTATDTGAGAVLCLAFPLHPPGNPAKTRIVELDAVSLPVLVVQGKSDPFGMPPPAGNRHVVELAGNHGLTSDLPGVVAAVEQWLAGLPG